ncbi:MAG: hypothetical protein IPQ15_00525 [Betaproteobacteria bacterium]|nr:hypothetical protein [Betaproteobacteria bacterium]
MAPMRSPPRLRLEPRPSRLLRRALVGASFATGSLVAGLPLSWPLRVLLVLVVLLLAMRAARATLGRGLPAIVHVGADRRLTVTGRDGRSRSGTIGPESCVGSRVTTVVWRADRADPAPRGPCRRRAALLILPDMLAPEDFRQLRVLLRYGRAPSLAGARATSAVAAGRPASQALPS